MDQILFSSFFGTLPKISSFRLPTHRRDAQLIGATLIGNFLMIPSLNGMEISVKGATSVLLGVKGLNKEVSKPDSNNIELSQLLIVLYLLQFYFIQMKFYLVQVKK